MKSRGITVEDALRSEAAYRALAEWRAIDEKYERLRDLHGRPRNDLIRDAYEADPQRNIQRIAKAAGVSRPTVYRAIQEITKISRSTIDRSLPGVRD